MTTEEIAGLRTAVVQGVMTADEETLQRLKEAIKPLRRKGKLITLREAAKRLEVCPRTLQRWAKTGGITVIKHSQRCHRYLQDEIDALAYTGLIGDVDGQQN